MAELRRRLLINGAIYELAVNQYGKGAPTKTTNGAAAVIYMDTDTGDLYKCTGGSLDNWIWAKIPNQEEVNSKFDKTGGNIVGGVNVSNAYSNGCGILYKNNSEEADYGTVLADTAKDGDRTEIVIRAKDQKAYLHRNGVLESIVPIPEVFAYDTGKVLGVVGGKLTWVELDVNYASVAWEEIVNVDFWGDFDVFQYFADTPISLVEGKTYKITIGNSSYIRTAVKVAENAIICGNASLFSSFENTGEPFYIRYAPKNNSLEFGFDRTFNGDILVRISMLESV